MTASARGDGDAARARASADGNDPQRDVPPLPSAAKLVRIGGRWMCRHELADVSDHDGAAPDVQLRP
jgi:hypothetical protein